MQAPTIKSFRITTAKSSCVLAGLYVKKLEALPAVRENQANVRHFHMISGLSVTRF
jgi:hypothetical protein